VDIEQLIERLAGSDPTPAAGTAAATVLDMALALSTKAVIRTSDAGPTGALAAQIAALRRRLATDGERVELTYAAALAALATGERVSIGEHVGEALDALLVLAGSATDVAELARTVADSCAPVARPDAASAAILAAAAAAVAAHLAGLNLLAPIDERAARARSLATAAQASAAAALAP